MSSWFWVLRFQACHTTSLWCCPLPGGKQETHTFLPQCNVYGRWNRFQGMWGMHAGPHWVIGHHGICTFSVGESGGNLKKEVKNIWKNCWKFGESALFKSALLSPDGNVLDVLRDKSWNVQGHWWCGKSWIGVGLIYKGGSYSESQWVPKTLARTLGTPLLRYSLTHSSLLHWQEANICFAAPEGPNNVHRPQTPVHHERLSGSQSSWLSGRAIVGVVA